MYRFIRAVLIASTLLTALGLFVLICRAPILMFIVIGVAVLFVARRSQPHSDVHGMARWATSSEVEKAGMI